MSNKGFSLIELIIVIFVIFVAFVTAYSVNQKIISYGLLSGSRFQATYLAQEGLELVRNIRDSNYISGNLWNNGLASCQSGCQIDYDDNSLSPYNDSFLKKESVFIGYGNGVRNTLFKRRIVVTPISDDKMEVTSEVFWQAQGKRNSVILKDFLYDWEN